MFFNNFNDERYSLAVPNVKWQLNHQMDLSFITTLKILLKDRVTEFRYIESKQLDLPTRSALSQGNTLIITNENHIEKPQGFTELSDLEKYLRSPSGKEDENFLRTQIFVKEETNTTIINVEQLDIRRYHILQAYIPRYLPGIFKEKPITEEERNLLKTLVKTDYDAYVAMVATFAKIQNIDLEANRAKLKKFQTERLTAEIDNVRNKITNLLDQAKAVMEKYEQLLTDKDDQNLKLLGLLAAQDEMKEDTALTTFFETHKNYTLFDVGKTLNYGVNTYLDFDGDAYARINKGVRFEEYYLKNDADLGLVANEIFNTRRVKVRICSAFALNPKGTVNLLNKKNGIDANALVNPHHCMHSCLGSWAEMMNDAVMDGNILYALECGDPCAATVNVLEEITFRPFVNSLRECVSKKVFFDTVTNKDYNYRELVKLLKGE